MLPSIFDQKHFETEVRGHEGALLSLYLPNGAYVLASEINGMGLPTYTNWAIATYPGDFDGDYENLPFKAYSNDENPLSLDVAIEQAIAAGEALPAFDHLKTIEIDRMLVLSTKHLSEFTDCNVLRILDTAFPKGSDGWFVQVPDTRHRTVRDIPDDLQTCLNYAASLACTWVLFDPRHKPVANLPTFNW